jgi:dTDP-D-glucose 4,6-dehydratase
MIISDLSKRKKAASGIHVSTDEVYGSLDHCRALLAVLEKGRDGEIYNIGVNCSLQRTSTCRC